MKKSDGGSHGKTEKYSIRDIINKYRWHPDYDFSLLSVIYIDRPKGFSELRGEEIEKVGYKFIYLKSGGAIPHHRVVEVRYDGKTVWKRR